MGSHGIKDQVAIVGMGCTKFGEHWDKGVDDMLIESTDEAFASAGIEKPDVDAFWLGHAMSGNSGMDLAAPLKLDNKPVTLVQNFCATGSEALRNACYAVASGAYDTAMAIGVEKVKDSGYQGLSGAARMPTDGTARTLTAAAMFSLVAPAYAKKYGVDEDELRMVLGSDLGEEPLQRRPQPPGAVPQGDVQGGHLRHARGCRPPGRVRLRRRGRRLGRRHRRPGRGRPSLHRQAALREGAVVRGGHQGGQPRPQLRLHHLPRGRRAAEDAYGQAGVTEPRAEIAWPRSTTASPPPSWCSPRTSGSPSEGWAGRRSWPGRSTWTVSCRSTPTAASSPSATPVGALVSGCSSSAGSNSGVRPRPNAASRPIARPRLGAQPGRLPGRDGVVHRDRGKRGRC